MEWGGLKEVGEGRGGVGVMRLIRGRRIEVIEEGRRGLEREIEGVWGGG